MSLINDEIANATDLLVVRKVKGINWKKLGIQFLLFLSPALLAIILAIVLDEHFRLYILGIFLLLIVPIYYCNLLPNQFYPFFIKYAEIEFEYIVRQGTFEVNFIYGRKQRSTCMPAFLISKMDRIAPYSGEDKTLADSSEFVHKYECWGTLDHPNNYVCFYTNDAGEKCCVIFQMNDKIQSLMKFHNKKALVETTLASK